MRPRTGWCCVYDQPFVADARSEHGLPTSENVGIDAQYNLIEIASNKSGHDGQHVFARVL